MKEAVFGQLFFFGRSILFGGILLWIYDFIRVARRIIPHGSFLVSLEDVTYWLLTGVLSFQTLYYYNWGELRGFFFLAVILGMGCYYFFISPKLMRLAERWIERERKIGRKVFYQMSSPCVKYWRISRNQLKDVGKGVKIALSRRNKRGEFDGEQSKKKNKEDET